MHNRRKFVLATGTALMSVSLAGCADEDEEPADEDTGEIEEDETEEDEPEDESNGEQEEEQEEDADGLEIVEHELVEEEFSVEVEGIVRNNGDDVESYVQVDVTFYDSDGTRIDNSMSNTSDLAPDEDWAFSVLTTEEADDIDEYDISVTDSAT